MQGNVYRNGYKGSNLDTKQFLYQQINDCQKLQQIPNENKYHIAPDIIYQYGVLNLFFKKLISVANLKRL